MQVLITGGLGFIGSNLVRHFLQKYPEYRVVNLDALTYAGHLENLLDVEKNPRYTFVKGSISDSQLVNEIMSGAKFGPIDGVLNLAAETHVDRSIVDPSIFVTTNVLGTQILLDAVLAQGTSNGTKGGAQNRLPYVQISTDEVYGSLGAEGYFTEETPLSPNSPYSASKAGADFICRAYFHTYGLPLAITRCSNNYGPFQHPEKLIPLFITNAMKDKSVPVYGDGLNVRDWLHVQDHCEAIDMVFHEGKPGEIYNIGGRNERKNIEITKLILRELGKPESLIEYVQDRLGHDRRYAIDSSKIQRELGWKPKHSFEAGIAEAVKWYKDNQKWVNAVMAEEKGLAETVMTGV